MFTVKSIKIYEGCKYVKNLKTGKTYRFEHRLSPDFFSDHICISASPNDLSKRPLSKFRTDLLKDVWLV